MGAVASTRCGQCGSPRADEASVCTECGHRFDDAVEVEQDPFIGQTLPGGHRVLELIGSGGMGRVYRAEQTQLGRTVAVKVIHPHLSRDETVKARFFTEAKAASQLNHPNSVSIIDFGTIEARPYLVMEFLRARDLTSVNEEEGPLEEERIADVLCQVLAALEEAHHLKIVHRDLKPENVLLQSLRSGADFVKVVDFGLAIIRQRVDLKRLTFPGMVCGTPQYMAPEHARGDDVDGRADLYSVGVILFELLTGRLPFDSNNPHDVVAMQLHDSPPDPREVSDDRSISPELADVVMRSLSKPLTERFQSAAEFSAALRQAVEGAALAGRISGRRIRCPQCRHLVKQDQKFCGHCGARLRRTSAPPARLAQLAMTVPSVTIRQSDIPREHPIARPEQLEWFDQLCAQARTTIAAGRLVGPGGAGKTRLLAELALRLEQRGDAVVKVGPDPWRAGVGYSALRDAISELAELPADGGHAGQWAGASAEARAGLEEIFGLSQGSATAGSTSWSHAPPLHLREGLLRPHAAEALRWAMDRAAPQAPTGRVALLVDDLHAVDGASRNALADLFAEPGCSKGLLIVAHEHGFELTGWRSAAQLTIEGLEPGQAAGLLEQSPQSVPPSVAATVEQCGEHVLPLYVDQVVRFAAEGGEDPPPGLSDLVALRIERLPNPRRRILQAVAVLGDGVPQEYALGMATDVSTTQFEDPARSLGLLGGAGLIVRRDGLLWLSHPVVRDVVLWGTPAEVRRRLHRQARRPSVVEVLNIPLEAQALHAIAAEDSFEALMLCDRVAMRAAERGDLDGCVNALRRGLELARREMSRGELEDPVDAQLHFSVKLGDALALRGDLMQADGVIREALDLGGPRAPARARLLASQAHVAHLRGRREAANQLLDQARAAAIEAGRRGLSAALDRLADAWVSDGDG